MALSQHRGIQRQYSNQLEDGLYFGAWLRQRRRALDLTQAELAARVGCARITIRRIEADELKPSQQLAELLAEHLGVPLEQRKSWLHFARGFAPVAQGHSIDLPITTPATPIAPPTNLPAPLTPFIGRASELLELAHLPIDPTSRLLTLVGQGGIGKTRLAIEAAQTLQQQFAHGVYFVSLAPLRTSEQIALAIAEAMNFPFQADGRSPKTQLADFLRHKAVLLILDNFEHLREGVDLLQELLQNCRHLRLWVTSRERLQLNSETVYTLGGLDFPPETSALDAQNYSAVALFVETARRIHPKFSLNSANEQAISQICRMVGGMPLGILVAAAWVKILSPSEIVAELRQSLDLLEAELLDLPERQRSIRTVLAQSWQRLSEAERAVMMRLAVFRGGFTRQAAQSVAGASLRMLSNLVNKSFVQVEPSGRYALHELLRQYAEAELAQAGQATDAHTAHCRYYTEFLQQCETDIKSHRQVAALDAIETDFANVREAWQWAVTQHDYAAVGGALEALYWFTEMRFRFQEGLELLRLAREQLAPAAGEAPHAVWGRVMACMLSQSSVFLEPLSESKARIETGLVIAQRDENRAAIAFCLWRLAMVIYLSGEVEAAIPYFEKSLAHYQALGDRFYQGYVLKDLGILYIKLDKSERGVTLLQQSLEVRRETGDTGGLVISLVAMGWNRYNRGQYTEAENCWQEGHRLRCMARTRHLQTTINFDLAWLALFNRGDLERVQTLAAEQQRMAVAIGDPLSNHRSLVINGLLAGIREEYHACRHLFQQRHLIHIDYFPFTDSWEQIGLCLAACGLADLPAARRHLQSILQISLSHQWPPNAAKGLTFAAIIAATSDQAERAAELLGLVFHHPLSPKGWLTQWPLLARLRTELATTLTPEGFASAWGRGAALELLPTAEAELAL